MSEYIGGGLTLIVLLHTGLCKFLLSLHSKHLINAPLRVHVYFMRIRRQRAERLGEIENEISRTYRSKLLK